MLGTGAFLYSSPSPVLSVANSVGIIVGRFPSSRRIFGWPFAVSPRPLIVDPTCMLSLSLALSPAGFGFLNLFSSSHFFWAASLAAAAVFFAAVVRSDSEICC